jgi:hypothetical protein
MTGVQGNPASGWQDRDDHSERVVVMLGPRSSGAGWTQLVVERAFQSRDELQSERVDGVSLTNHEMWWRIATVDLNGMLLQFGDWIGREDGTWWCVQDSGLDTGPYGQEQRPLTIKALGQGGLPWLI